MHDDIDDVSQIVDSSASDDIGAFSLGYVDEMLFRPKGFFRICTLGAAQAWWQVSIIHHEISKVYGMEHQSAPATPVHQRQVPEGQSGKEQQATKEAGGETGLQRQWSSHQPAVPASLFDPTELPKYVADDGDGGEFQPSKRGEEARDRPSPA